MDNIEKFILGAVLGVMISVIGMATFLSNISQTYEVKTPIVPDTIVEHNNGEYDTVYVYKFEPEE